jgi:hypothetical protein
MDNYYIEQFNNAVDNMGEYDETKRKPTIFHFVEHEYHSHFFEFVLQPLSSKLEREQRAIIGSYNINEPDETCIRAYILDWCDNEYTPALSGLNWIPYEESESNHLSELIEYIRNVYIPAEIAKYKAENN